MTREELTHLLQTEIPLCGFMNLSVNSVSREKIETSAPIAPNRNMHQTGFAGSLYALAVATGWALVHFRMTEESLDALLVVKKATITYKRPVQSDITLAACLPPEDAEASLAERLQAAGKLIIPLKIDFLSEGKRCGYLEADYTIVRTPATQHA